MCGRTSIAVDAADVEARFDVQTTAAVREYLPRYNVGPGDGLLAITNERADTADVLEWGFVPAWADDPEDGPRPINARAGGVRENDLFREAFAERRCLVVADGFYEWHGDRGRKQPYRVVRRDREPFAFAGIWSQWEGDGRTRTSTAILTTEPNEVVASIHDRMPVLLERDEEATWLAGGAEAATSALDPHPAEEMTAYPVSKAVNNPENEGPALHEEVDVDEQSGLDDFAA